jgi:hypothetical protein
MSRPDNQVQQAAKADDSESMDWLSGFGLMGIDVYPYRLWWYLHGMA